MIRVVKVNKYYNRFRKNQNHVINNTSLVLGDTGLVALLGPSGSGKTTLLNAIGGLDKINSGKIYINNKKISGHNIYRIDKLRNLNIGYIFQDYKLVDTMSVFDNVALSLKTIGIKDKKEIEKRVYYVLEKVGMYRYRKRPASMLSGGERQRVGIARAIVKNPNIIIADEPTGNLDSKNSLEIMNIIKKISEDRLVLLVTHEVNLAKFYASRIIEIEDGKIISDVENNHEDNLDYTIDNNIYLKDFNDSYEDLNLGVNVYRNQDIPLNVEIVLKGNNIFIRSTDNRKIEVVDDNSSIEFIHDHYKTMKKKDLKSIQFDYEQLKNTKRLRYSSIFNPITFLTNGFLKVLEYSLVKKILLIGFFLSGFFIMMSASRITANLEIHDKDFVDTNKNYLKLNVGKIDMDEFNLYRSYEGVDYAIPGSSKVAFQLKVNDYYQTAKTNSNVEGSLASIRMIQDHDLLIGRMPENEREVVIDKMVVDNLKNSMNIAKMIGLYRNKDFLNRNLQITNMEDFTIVGITNLESPSIYVSDNMFLNILFNNTSSVDEYGEYSEDTTSNYQDYHLFQDKVVLKEGRWPENDYEVLVNINHKEDMKLWKTINDKIHGQKLLVVGYYDSEDNIDKYFVNSNMIWILLVKKSKNMVVYPVNREEVMSQFRENNVLVEDSYQASKNKYLKSREAGTKVAITSSLIVLGISLIEIILMLRSSFLSRIREVGIYRAIGLKKRDIYTMFSGEILAITTLTSLPGILLSAYIFDKISHVRYLGSEFVVHLPIVLFVILCVYVFNILCGLIPVIFTLRKRPAEILSRTDI